MRKYFKESFDASKTVDNLKKGLQLLADEWVSVSKNFVYTDDDEIEVGVDIINTSISTSEISTSDEIEEVAELLEEKITNDVFDEVYVLNNGSDVYIVAEILITSKDKLTKDERKQLSFAKGAVTIKPERETGRDYIKVYIKVSSD